MENSGHYAELSASRVQTQVSDGGHDVPLVDVLRPFGRNTENLAIGRTGLGSVAIISSGAAPYAEMNPSAFLCHCLLPQSKSFDFRSNAASWHQDRCQQVRARTR